VTTGLPAVLANPGRRLADVARPAGRGLERYRRVVFRPAPCDIQQATAEWMAQELALEIGPTRVGPVMVEAFHRRGEVATALLDQRFAGQPAQTLTAALIAYDTARATLGCAVLLIAHSLVLWPQVEPSRKWLRS